MEIYKKSIIDWDDLYESIIVMSANTSNNFDTINKMEFYKFKVLSDKLGKYIEAKNNAEGGGNENTNEQFETIQNQSKTMMNNAKQSMGNMKMPDMKMPNIKLK